MFSKTIIDSDAFLDMPLSTQALYFHLAMRADDDGFINNPRKIQRMITATDDDLKLLIAKNFIIPFESGLIVIKHWKIHNYIPKDRYHETTYLDEKKLLVVKANREYDTVDSLDTICIQNVSGMDTQASKEESSGEKENCRSVAHMIDESSLSDPVRESLQDWLKYKTERRESYKEQGLRALITQVKKAEDQQGAAAVVDLIQASMASGYRGITWDRLRGRASPGGGRSAKVNQFTQMEQRQDYDFEEIERESLIHD